MRISATRQFGPCVDDGKLYVRIATAISVASDRQALDENEHNQGDELRLQFVASRKCRKGIAKSSKR